MTEAAPPRLLTREREELDAIAESIREGRRIVAFLVCAPEMRAEVLGYLSGVSGRVVPPPAEVKDPEGMLALLTEAAEAGVGDVRSVDVDPGREETVRALNWHREKLRKGASLLVWIPDVDGLRVVRRLAPDAFSFRDILVAVEGEKSQPVVRGDTEHIDVRLERGRYEAAGSRLEKLRAADRLADELRPRLATSEALAVLREALEMVRPQEPLSEEEAVALARVHLQASSALRRDGRRVESSRHVAEGLSIVRGLTGASARGVQREAAIRTASPNGPDNRLILGTLAEERDEPMDGIGWLVRVAAAISDGERGDTRRATALFRDMAGSPHIRPLNLAVVQEAQCGLALKAGRLDEAEGLLGAAWSVWRTEAAGNQNGILALAELRLLGGELAAAQKLMATLAEAGEDELWALRARRELKRILLESGAVHDGLAGLVALLHKAEAARRDGRIYEVASVCTDCVVEAHEAERLAPEDHADALTALREAQEVAISMSGDDPPWYHALFPLLRGQVLVLSPERVSEAIDMTRAARDLCERSFTDAAPMAARTLATHLVKAGRYEEALSTIERVTPQLVQERFLEELARVRTLKIACLVHGKATAPEIEATLADMRATFEEMEAPRITADTLLELAWLLPPDSPHPDTLSLLEEAHEMFAEMRIVAREARCLEAIGDVLVARGDIQEARRRHLTAKEILERTGLLLRVPLLEKKLAAGR